jgi:hypothetical protein
MNERDVTLLRRPRSLKGGRERFRLAQRKQV